jgi:hypothetical protein
VLREDWVSQTDSGISGISGVQRLAVGSTLLLNLRMYCFWKSRGQYTAYEFETI